MVQNFDRIVWHSLMLMTTFHCQYILFCLHGCCNIHTNNNSSQLSLSLFCQHSCRPILTIDNTLQPYLTLFYRHSRGHIHTNNISQLCVTSFVNIAEDLPMTFHSRYGVSFCQHRWGDTFTPVTIHIHQIHHTVTTAGHTFILVTRLYSLCLYT